MEKHRWKPLGKKGVKLPHKLNFVSTWVSMSTGEGNIKYTYNNGLMAKDPETAAMNFLRALEKLPGFVKQEQEKIAEIQKDLPILQEVVNGTWAKESRLSELKTELAAVERKIQLSITPETKQDASEQAEKQNEAPKVQESIIRTKGVHSPRGVL